MHPLIIITALLLPEDTQLETPIVKYDMNTNSMCRCSPHGHMEKTLAFAKFLGVSKLREGPMNYLSIPNRYPKSQTILSSHQTLARHGRSPEFLPVVGTNVIPKSPLELNSCTL